MWLVWWLAVVSETVCTVRQALSRNTVKSTALRQIVVRVGDVNIDFFMGALGFQELFNKGLLGGFGVKQGRNDIAIRRTGVQFADKDAAGGMVAVVPCVDADAFKVGHHVEDG